MIKQSDNNSFTRFITVLNHVTNIYYLYTQLRQLTDYPCKQQLNI